MSIWIRLFIISKSSPRTYIRTSGKYILVEDRCKANVMYRILDLLLITHLFFLSHWYFHAVPRDAGQNFELFILGRTGVIPALFIRHWLWHRSLDSSVLTFRGLFSDSQIIVIIIPGSISNTYSLLDVEWVHHHTLARFVLRSCHVFICTGYRWASLAIQNTIAHRDYKHPCCALISSDGSHQARDTKYHT